MQFVPSVPSVAVTPGSRRVKSLSATYAVKPVFPRDHPSPYETENQENYLPPEPEAAPPAITENRRTYCRRVKHLPVLEELRSGVDRRKHNLLEGDVVEHIDESA
ncbi:MAG: hypothetical protein WC742_07905 [Gallionellaceae bacterium]|jgi:hypothetical protein